MLDAPIDIERFSYRRSVRMCEGIHKYIQNIIRTEFDIIV